MNENPFEENNGKTPAENGQPAAGAPEEHAGAPEEHAAAPEEHAAAPEGNAPAPESGEYHYTRPAAGADSFTDANYIPKDQAPRAPHVYAYAEPEPAPKAEKPPKKHHRVRAGAVVALCVACVLLGAGVGVLASRGGAASTAAVTATAEATQAPTAEATAAPTPLTTAEPTAAASAAATSSSLVLSSDETSAADMSAQDIYDLACQQVVGITTEVTYNVYGYSTTAAVSGTGIIISADGYILTNHHVIADALAGGYDVEVMLYDGTTYKATIVGYESDNNDIAVLKIDATGLNPVTLGDSNTMQVGQTIYAVGNPLGELTYTMTQGMISALDREITTQDETTGVSSTVNMFQVDAAINSGNSGGPIYNTEGKVIGIVTAKYSSTGVEGLGFAIPINDAISIANDIIENGYVRGKPYMGISVQTVSSAVAQYYNMVEGAYVYTVEAGSSAETAGLQRGDIITGLDDTKITSSSDLTTAEKNYRAGDKATLTVYRDGNYLTLSITFDEKVPTTTTTGTTQQQESSSSQQQQQQIPGGFSGYGSYGGTAGTGTGTSGW